MSNTPEKIWAIRKDGGNGGIYTTNENISTDDRLVEYIRADLVNDWMDIDTAPKDGTKIVGSYHDGFRSFKVDVFYYCIGTWWIDDYSEGDKQPTHWQPLPTPPPAT